MSVTDLPRRSRRRSRSLVAAAVALALLLALGGWWWIHRDDDTDAVRRLGQQIAMDLRAGTVPDGLRVDDRDAAQEHLDAVLAGMGRLRPSVTVGAVEVPDGGDTGTVHLDLTWTVHEGKAPWRYSSTVPVRRSGDSWTGDWAATVLAPELGEGEVLRATRVTPERGEVLGDGGETIVTRRPVVRVGIDRGQVPAAQAGSSARQLAEAADVTVAPFVTAVESAGDKAFVEAIVLRADAKELERVRRAVPGIAGARLVDGSMDLPPSSGFASAVLGRVGPATAEIISADPQVRAGDVVGLSGLQATHDKELRGTSGFVVEAVAEDGTARDLHRLDAVDGTPLRTTLSINHQTAAEDALADVPKAGAVVAIRPSDGHVLALASAKGGSGQPTATLGQYAPGSTFKPVTALAQLRAGATPGTQLQCPPTITVDGREFKNYDDYPSGRNGAMTLKDAIATSCNTALIGARDRLPADGISSAAAALGMTQTPTLGVPAAMGQVPARPTGTDLAATSIGQGEVVATPLSMATVMASIVAEDRVTPVLLPGATTAPAKGGAPITAGEAGQLREMLRAVVTDGSATFLGDNPGGPVIAKTGTAEYGSASPPRTHAWMIVAQDDLAVAVFVEDGSGGASVAGSIADRYLGLVRR
ncbi:hypothetical protein ASG73_11255 [Janibacter sp. Soil728]|uniref:penicillin-binding transpeptidase domain-containing protein n=1 Tax=Janibacter sp. Soil728 TaxID=1736393 RepID=UPI0006FA9BD6|nr:penicillin-binding transpeptidase domain-containing protein [Janibacter sp. Soil728]KRE36902.1 hypothetical protein ASG73_11255 [Janibacter sp. Soil728]